MSRKPDFKTKEEILEKVLSVLSKIGLNKMSLRDIARETGVSARMLIYHFGSFENLINSIFIQLSIRHKNILKTILSEHSDKSLGNVLQISMEIIMVDENKNSLLLFLELYIKALRDVENYNSFFDEVLYNWISEIENIIGNKHGVSAGIYATIIVSFYRGLMLDWLAGDNNERIIESSRSFTALINNLLEI